MSHEIQSTTDAPAATLAVQRLGRCAYAPTRDAMIAFTRARDDATPDALWLLEHPPVYTLGQAGRIEHLLAATDIPVVRTERGGQITYHGPGQLIAYALVDLKRRGIRVREFVALLEDVVIETLAAYNLHGLRKTGAPGVYVRHDDRLQKIAALGLKVVNGCTFHGLSINVAMDLAPYDRIDPCGFPGLKTIDLATLGCVATVDDVGDRLAEHFSTRLQTAWQQRD